MSIFGKPLTPATAEQCCRPWSGSKNGLRFRCKVCGHRFVECDLFRMVYANGPESPTRTGNFLVCEACDEEFDHVLLARMAEIEKEAYTRFWWLVDDDRQLERWDTPS